MRPGFVRKTSRELPFVSFPNGNEEIKGKRETELPLPAEKLKRQTDQPTTSPLLPIIITLLLLLRAADFFLLLLRAARRSARGARDNVVARVRVRHALVGLVFGAPPGGFDFQVGVAGGGGGSGRLGESRCAGGGFVGGCSDWVGCWGVCVVGVVGFVLVVVVPCDVFFVVGCCVCDWNMSVGIMFWQAAVLLGIAYP